MEDKARLSEAMDATLTTITVFSTDLKKIRELNKKAFKSHDLVSDAPSEKVYQLVREGLKAFGGVDLDTFMEDLPNAQMKEDLHDALIVLMAYKDACALATAMLLLKGIIIPLTNELKDAKQTIQTLTKVKEGN